MYSTHKSRLRRYRRVSRTSNTASSPYKRLNIPFEADQSVSTTLAEMIAAELDL